MMFEQGNEKDEVREGTPGKLGGREVYQVRMGNKFSTAGRDMRMRRRWRGGHNEEASMEQGFFTAMTASKHRGD
eukprot:482762-Hanusia_phi.AAC.2